MASQALRRLAVPGGLLASVPLVAGYKVRAADEGSQKRIKASELPVYEEGLDTKFEFTDESISPYRANVSKVRSAVWTYLESVQETTTKVQDKWEVAKAHTNDLLTYFKDDPGALPRAGVIVVAGLGGIVAGYKGGSFRKASFATIGMVSAAAICYPYQAVDIGRGGWDKVSGHAKDMWQSPGKKPEPVEKTKTEPVKKAEPVEKTKTDPVKKAEPVEKTKTDPVKKEEVSKESSSKESEKPQKKIEGDPGMSKEEDKDMYTTRS